MTEIYPQNRRVGYARISTYGQTLNVQLEQLRGTGCTKIFREKVTGAHNDRRQLLKMLDTIAPGDVVTGTRIDRLARSTFDLFAIVKQIVDSKAQFRSLAEPWADTDTSTGRLIIAVLGGLADVERELIRTRTAEGRSRAQKRGRAAHGPTLQADRSPEGRSTAAAGERRDPCRTRPQLRRGEKHDFAPHDLTRRRFHADGMSVSRGRQPKRPSRKCIFCGEGGTGGNPMTEEHLWPEWMHPYLPQVSGRGRKPAVIEFDLEKSSPSVKFGKVMFSQNGSD